MKYNIKSEVKKFKIILIIISLLFLSCKPAYKNDAMLKIDTFEFFVKASKEFADEIGFLDGDYFIFPLENDYGYDATPKNSLTFQSMGVDGVHICLIETNGKFDENSIVVQVSPMDFDEEIAVLAPTFINYLADGCKTKRDKIISLVNENNKKKFLQYLVKNFQGIDLLDDDRVEKLNKKYLNFVNKK